MLRRHYCLDSLGTVGEKKKKTIERSKSVDEPRRGPTHHQCRFATATVGLFAKDWGQLTIAGDVLCHIFAGSISNLMHVRHSFWIISS